MPTRDDDHTVLLLHGQPGAPLDWHHVVTSLPDGFVGLAPPRPGYGRNPEPPGGLEANADALARFLDHHQVDRALVAGHSWGGGVALAMAQRHPDRVAGLVLAAALGPGALLPFDWLLGAPVAGEALAWLTFSVARPIVRRSRHRLDALPLDGLDHEGFEADLSASRRRGIWHTFLVEQRAMLRELPGLVGRLDSISAPTIVLAGTADRIVPPRTAVALVDAIPDAELRMLQGANHPLPWTHPADIVRAIRDIARHSSSTPGATTPGHPSARRPPGPRLSG